jgi:hypothetical protein
MSPRRRRKTRLYTKSAALAFAVPQVIGHRLMRMASSGKPTRRDRREFDRMITEKAEALGEAWSRMAVKTFQANQEIAFSLMKGWMRGSPSVVQHAAALQRTATEVLAAGLAPVHRRAVANARRLNRRRKAIR